VKVLVYHKYSTLLLFWSIYRDDDDDDDDDDADIEGIVTRQYCSLGKGKSFLCASHAITISAI
jgi:hypothetical protein